jgi:hypothetical protein
LAIKQKLSDKQKLFKYFDITDELIVCKYNTVVELNMNDYKMEDEELLELPDEDEQDAYAYDIPGIFEAFIPDENDTVSFALPFIVHLIKTEDTSIKNNVITLNFEVGDKLLFTTTKGSGADLQIITKLLDNQVKYLRGNIPKTIDMLWTQISSASRIKLHHIELVYTIMYGKDTSSGFVPTRLGNQIYDKESALSSKDSAQSFGSTNAFNFGYSNEAILKNVTRDPNIKPPKSDLEKIIAAEYHDLPIKDGA